MSPERGCRADEGKARQIEPNSASRRTLTQDDVDFEVFHRGVEVFFGDAAQTVDFVDKKDVTVV